MQKAINSKELTSILETFNIQKINQNRNYWLFRTSSNKYFEEFYINNFIALGDQNFDIYDKIDLNIIQNFKKNNIIEKIRKYNLRDNNLNDAINYVNIFVNQMKQGDIILLSNKYSNHIAFGELLEDDVYQIDENEYQKLYKKKRCYYRKRRKLKWYKCDNKNKLDLYIHKLLNSHYKITSANEYAHYIDRSLHDLFIKNDEAYIVFRVWHKEKILATDVIEFIENILNSIDIYNEYFQDNLKKNEIDLKLNIQSPGPIEFSGDIYTCLIIALIIIGIFGGKFSFEFTKDKQKAEVGTKGLLGRLIEIMKLMNSNDKQIKDFKETTKKAAEKLNVKPPKINKEDDENIMKN